MEWLTINVTPRVRRDTLYGREHLVAPVSLIVPGVLAGNQGPLYYPPDEVARNYQVWNNTPIVVYHPSVGGQDVSARHPEILNARYVGVVLRAKIDNKGRLVAEGWFDIENTRRVDQRVLQALLNNKPIELSTGLYTDNYPAPHGATHNGRPYTYIARNYRPDHLAILPDQIGACSINDGCGVLVNRRQCKCGGKCDSCKSQWVPLLNGGPGSGHHGHEGRPGEVGGSAPDDAGGGSIDAQRAAQRARLDKVYGRGPKNPSAVHPVDELQRRIGGRSLTPQEQQQIEDEISAESQQEKLKDPWVRLRKAADQVQRRKVYEGELGPNEYEYESPEIEYYRDGQEGGVTQIRKAKRYMGPGGRAPAGPSAADEKLAGLRGPIPAQGDYPDADVPYTSGPVKQPYWGRSRAPWHPLSGGTHVYEKPAGRDYQRALGKYDRPPVVPPSSGSVPFAGETEARTQFAPRVSSDKETLRQRYLQKQIAKRKLRGLRRNRWQPITNRKLTLSRKRRRRAAVRNSWMPLTQ